MPYKIYSKDFEKSERARMELQEEEYKKFELLQKSKISGKLEALGIGGISPQVSNQQKEKMLLDSAKKLAEAYKLAEKEINGFVDSSKGLKKTIDRLQNVGSRTEEQEKKLLEAQKALSDTTKETERLRKGQTRLEKEITSRTEQIQKIKGKGFFGSEKATEIIKAGGSALSGSGSMLNSMMSIAELMGAPVMLGVIATVAANAYEKLKAGPREATIASGKAIEAVVGTQIQNLYGSKSGLFKEFGFQEERRRAERMATEETEDPINRSLFFLKNMGSYVFNRQKYTAEFEKLRGIRKNELLQAETETDPFKKQAVENAEQLRMQALQAQRLMGLSESGRGGYYGAGGFAARAQTAGFTPEMMSSMAAQMQAAGGSTLGMRQLSKLGLQAERGLDLTNAGTILGRLTGITAGAGGAAQSEQMFKRIFTEAVSLGIDKSDFREEQRNFADITSKFIYDSSAKTGEQAAQVVKEFSRFLGEKPTTKELGEAAGAYKKFQSTTAETTGRAGALQFAGLLKDEKLKNLDFRSMASLMSLEESQLDPNNPLVQTLAAKLGMKSPKELVERARKVKQEAVYGVSGLDPNKMKILQRLKKTGTLSFKEQERMRAGTTEEKEAVEAYEASETYAQSYGPFKSVEQREAFAKRLREGISPEKAYKDITGGKLDKQLNEITRSGDTVIKSFAEQSKILIENLQALKDVTTPTAKSVHDLNEEFKETYRITKEKLNPTKTSYYEGGPPAVEGRQPEATNQTQAGRKSE